MDDNYFRGMVLAVAAILIVSLTINILLVSDPQSFSSPPIRMSGYITGQGQPASGYYFTPDVSAVHLYLNDDSSGSCG